MNRYSECGGFIIDATGKQWPVDVAHPLPLPEGIDEEMHGYLRMLNFFDGGRWTNDMACDSTHWLARRPLPEIPKPKTQEELDEEAFRAIYKHLDLQKTSNGWGGPVYFHSHVQALWEGFQKGCAYARKGQQ